MTPAEAYAATEALVREVFVVVMVFMCLVSFTLGMLVIRR